MHNRSLTPPAHPFAPKHQVHGVSGMDLTIRGKLVAVVCLSLLPIALLGYLFVTQSQKDIAFSSKEALGTEYYAALAADLASLSGAGPLPAPAAFDGARARLDAV